MHRETCRAPAAATVRAQYSCCTAPERGKEVRRASTAVCRACGIMRAPLAACIGRSQISSVPLLALCCRHVEVGCVRHESLPAAPSRRLTALLVPGGCGQALLQGLAQRCGRCSSEGVQNVGAVPQPQFGQHPRRRGCGRCCLCGCGTCWRYKRGTRRGGWRGGCWRVWRTWHRSWC